MTDVVVGGTFQLIPLSKLLLDVENPRLPESLRAAGASQDDLALYIDKHHDAARVARSVEKHGFFMSEPLIAVRDDDDHFTVVEGNRRLVALRGLTDDALRARLEGQTSTWKRLGKLDPETEIPVVVVDEKAQVDALLGFRHISGIEPWDPYAQARFIAQLMGRFNDFEVVAERVGRTVSEVRSMYRDQDIVEQAREEFGVDTSRVEASFGVLNAAMGIVALRSYVGAPAPRDVDAEFYPIPEENAEQVKRLITYVFGDSRGRGRVISDSRRLKELGKVLADPTGAAEAELRRTSDLDAALEATASEEEAALRDLRRAIKALAAAATRVRGGGFASVSLSPLVAECATAVQQLEELLADA